MRKIVTLVCMMLIGASCYADEDSEKYKSIDSICKSISKSSAMVMQARQANVPMSEQMDILGDGSFGESFTSTMRKIIIAAYDSPRFSTASYQAQAVNDFENENMLNCLKQYSRY